jgi:hypothetical protein
MIAASKANKQSTSYLALALKTTKLLRLITKAMNMEWHGGEAWKGKKALLETYRPHDVLTVSALEKRLNAVSLKGNQDHPDVFEEPEATEHAYLETKANLGSHNLSALSPLETG